MISIELWRARIGLHCGCKCNNNNNNPQSTTNQPDSSVSIFSALPACIIALLIVIGGIEINPGPITPTQDTNHKQGNLTGYVMNKDNFYCYFFRTTRRDQVYHRRTPLHNTTI